MSCYIQSHKLVQISCVHYHMHASSTLCLRVLFCTMLCKLQQYLYFKPRMCGTKLLQLCANLCNPMDCSPPGSSAHGFLQARTLEWVTIPFSRGSSQPRDQTQVSCIAGRFFTVGVTREEQDVPKVWVNLPKQTARSLTKPCPSI